MFIPNLSAFHKLIIKQAQTSQKYTGKFSECSSFSCTNIHAICLPFFCILSECSVVIPVLLPSAVPFPLPLPPSAAPSTAGLSLRASQRGICVLALPGSCHPAGCGFIPVYSGTSGPGQVLTPWGTEGDLATVNSSRQNFWPCFEGLF